MTPFAPRARDKVLRAIIVALAFRNTDMTVKDCELTHERKETVIKEVIPYVMKRFGWIDDEELDNCEAEIIRFLDDWESKGRTVLWNDHKPAESLFVSAERAAMGRAVGQSAQTWSAPNSMRDVEPDVQIKVRNNLR